MVKLTLAAFILNMFVKAAMIYSALTLAVAFSMEEESSAIDSNQEEGTSSATSNKGLELEKSNNEDWTPASKSLGVTFSSDVEEETNFRSEDEENTWCRKDAISPVHIE